MSALDDAIEQCGMHEAWVDAARSELETLRRLAAIVSHLDRLLDHPEHRGGQLEHALEQARREG